MPRRIKKLEKEQRYFPVRFGRISTYNLMRSSRRRSIAISVNETGDVSVYAPKFVSEKAIRGFIDEKSQWIVEKVGEAKKKQEIIHRRKYVDGHKFLFLGEKRELKIFEEDRKKASIDFDQTRWAISLPLGLSPEEKEEISRKKLIGWYKTQAKEILGGRVFHYSRIIGIEPLDIVVKTQKNLWGSCHYDKKKINLNWQIILAPIEVIDYVIVHELCHIQVPNHSKRYWKKVEKIIPQYRKYRKWLRDNTVDMRLPQASI